MKQKKQKPTKRTNKYQKPLSLHGMPEIEVVKELLKSPPMPKSQTKEK
ncbi:hypothetical protein ANAEL_02494 [Anaerolineales bacterium]|nr:hypothetical protein ANAEL_02494 [Anaerolineales bacterium]